MNLFQRRTPLLVVALALFACASHLFAAPVGLVDEAPASIGTSKSGLVLVDFGKVAFGNLRIIPPAGSNAMITVHFGEAFADGSINRKPPGTVRYASASFTMKDGKVFTAAPAADKRNTEQVSAAHPPAILTPPEWGVVLPFRWVEIEGWPGQLQAGQITRQSAHADWMRTGDKAWLAPRYEALKAKTLLNRADADGLIRSDALQIKKTDIVDWPVGERNKFVFTEINTVVNAFHLRAVSDLAELASALGKVEEAKGFIARFVATRAKFQEVLFDEKRGVYVDGKPVKAQREGARWILADDLAGTAKIEVK